MLRQKGAVTGARALVHSSISSTRAVRKRKKQLISRVLQTIFFNSYCLGGNRFWEVQVIFVFPTFSSGKGFLDSHQDWTQINIISILGQEMLRPELLAELFQMSQKVFLSY